MASTFVPLEGLFPTNKEREWAGTIGMLDWDTTKIVFTKRQLVDFLKYTGVTVDVNAGNISRLPKYASFGKLVAGSGVNEAADVAPVAPVAAVSHAAATGRVDDFKPTRRVRENPGGKQTLNVFGGDDSEEESVVPPARPMAREEPIPLASVQKGLSISEAGSNPMPGFKPTRRVREMPGGKQSINLFGGDDEEDDQPMTISQTRQASLPQEQPEHQARGTGRKQSRGGQTTLGLGMFEQNDEPAEKFVPTRKVREAPGGEDHIGFD